jgi:starvation-inducible DNA-binding protein
MKICQDSALCHTDREVIGVELQKVLVTLVDLALIGKHAHWNVVGPDFRSLHLELDEMIDTWRAAADAVGERAVALGHWPDGRTATVGARTQLTSLTDGPQPDSSLVAALTVRLADTVDLVREYTDRVQDIDTVTADLLRGIVATLEQQLIVAAGPNGSAQERHADLKSLDVSRVLSLLR